MADSMAGNECGSSGLATSGFKLVGRCSMLLGGRRSARDAVSESELKKVTRIQALSIAVLSLWVGWTLFMWFAATRSFRTVEEVLKSPPPQFSSDVQGLKPEQTREVLRYMASEINRTYFRAYGWGQLVLGTVLLLLLAWKTPRNGLDPAIAAIMLFIVIILTLGVMPQIISLGRSIDFLPRTPPPPGYQRFWKLHMMFTGLDGTKLLGGIALLIRLIAFR
jgi:uncharacterized membrane protein YkgB